MNVKYILTIVVAFLMGGIAFALVSGSIEHRGATHDEQLYTCGMHPQVIQDHPGNCPICGMKLTPMKDKGAKSEGSLVVPSNIRQSIGVRTARVERAPLSRTVRTVARIEANERKEVVVTTKFSGWIEKLYVNETGQFVRRGQALFAIYSPEVLTAQEEFLLAVRQKNAVLERNARERLLAWDMTSRQVSALKERGRTERSISVYSPATGYVVRKNAVDGAQVGPGKALFRIVDLNTVWVKADVYEHEVPFIREGQEAVLSLSYIPGREFKGKVAYVYPTVAETSRTVQVRLEFENPGLDLKPGMFGTVRIETQGKEAVLQVPSEAIVRTGERNIVFLEYGDGSFDAVEVSLGLESGDGRAEVLSGLSEGQRIVVSSQFLLDSESQLAEAVEKMRPGGQPASQPASRPASGPASQPASGPTSRPTP